MGNSIHESSAIIDALRRYSFCKIIGHTALKHILSILIAVFRCGYKGKTVQFAQASSCHRTTIAHFLSRGKWDSEGLESLLKEEVIRIIYGEARKTGKPIYCFVDDTISSKTKPSSQALHPIEDAYFHQSHLKKKQDYGHQAVAVMLSCNGITLNYAIVMYDKTKSKIQIVQEIVEELPETPVRSYFSCDCWYTCGKIVTAFSKKGFYTIGAIKTNRLVTLEGNILQIGQLAPALQLAGLTADLATVGKRQFYVYSCRVQIDNIGDAVILLSYSREAFGKPSALRAFVCTDLSLSITEILNHYMLRWNIEVFFRQAKQKLALDKYQIRSSQGIKRFWLLMSLAHFLCCVGTGQTLSFEDGYHYFQKELIKERVEYIYRCGYARLPLEDVLSLVA